MGLFGGIASAFGGSAKGAGGAFGGGFGGGRRQPQRGGSVMGQDGGWVPPDDPNAVHDPMQAASQGGTLGDLYQPAGGGNMPYNPGGGGGNLADYGSGGVNKNAGGGWMPQGGGGNPFNSGGGDTMKNIAGGAPPANDFSGEAPEDEMGAGEAQARAAQPQQPQGNLSDYAAPQPQGGDAPIGANSDPRAQKQLQDMWERMRGGGGEAMPPPFAQQRDPRIIRNFGGGGAPMRRPMGMQQPMPTMSRMGKLQDLIRSGRGQQIGSAVRRALGPRDGRYTTDV